MIFDKGGRGVSQFQISYIHFKIPLVGMSASDTLVTLVPFVTLVTLVILETN